MTQSYGYSQDRLATMEGAFIRRVYNWMIVGLAVTGLVAYMVSHNDGILKLIYGSQIIFFGLIMAELALVFILSARIGKMSASTAGTMFIVYSLLNGLTLSFVFLVYTKSTISSAFFVTAGTFGAMSVFGYTTKRDLTSWGSFLFMGLIGIIIASVVNIFFHSELVEWMITYVGVLVFVGLTAYDTQNLKAIGRAGFSGAEGESKAAIIGSLRLYLDFINLFLMILRIFGRRS